MLLALPGLISVLALAPPGAVPEQPPLQAPVRAEPRPPTLPPSSDGAVAAEPTAEAPEADSAVPEEPPAAAPPESEPVAPPQPDTVVGPQPAPTEPAPTVSPDFEDSAPGLHPDLGRDYVTIKAPTWRGTGQFIAAASLFGLGVAFQVGDTVLCGNCASGVFERVVFGTSMGLAAGGGVMRGHADAYDDAALRRDRREVRRTLIMGAALTGVGAVMGLANEGMWWNCWINGEGPYADGGFDCRQGLSRGILDVATATTATGLGMLTWSLTYRRDARAYTRARVIGLRPTFGRERVALSLEGRF